MAVTSVKSTTTEDIFQKTEAFLAKHSNILFMICMAFTALFGLLLFDGRMSFATDDSSYILEANSFLKNNVYPNYHGALYPLFLSVMIKLFGIRILLFKTCSLIFLLLNNYIFYRAFKNRVPYLVLFCGLIVFSINAYFLTNGSSTFSEAFYLVIQSISFLAFFKLLEKLKSPDSNLKNTLKYWLLYGFTFLVLSITKNVAVFAFLGVVGYFLVRKEWKYALLAFSFFLVYKLPFELALRQKFPTIGVAQLNQQLQRDFYDPSKGKVIEFQSGFPFIKDIDFSELTDRFIGNFGNYFTVHTFKILGMREAGVSSLWSADKMKEMKYSQDPATGERIQENLKPGFLFALLFIGLFGLGLWQSYKHNPFLFYALLYVLTLSIVSFFALQTFWNQDRLVLIYTPIIFMGFFYGLYKLIQEKNIAIAKPILLIIFGLVILIQLGQTLGDTSKNSRQFKCYTKGDVFCGYPESIANYLKVCSWIKDSLHDSASILAARPVEARVFGNGHSFARMPQLKKEQQTPDSLLAVLHRNKIGYIIEDQFTGQMAELTQFLRQNKPQSIKDIYTEGDAVLVKIVQ